MEKRPDVRKRRGMGRTRGGREQVGKGAELGMTGRLLAGASGREGQL